MSVEEKPEEEIAGEAEEERECGFRKINRLYLVGAGERVACDQLPFEFKPCDCCGLTPSFTRTFTWIPRKYFVNRTYKEHINPRRLEELACTCDYLCPICHADNSALDVSTNNDNFGLMYVGGDYTPRSFAVEAESLGVSKTINQIPKGLVLGKTRVMLAHNRIPFYEQMEDGKTKVRYARGIFYSFVPQRIEVLVWEDEDPEKIRAYKEKGITVIVKLKSATQHSRAWR